MAAVVLSDGLESVSSGHIAARFTATSIKGRRHALQGEFKSAEETSQTLLVPMIRSSSFPKPVFSFSRSEVIPVVHKHHSEDPHLSLVVMQHKQSANTFPATQTKN